MTIVIFTDRLHFTSLKTSIRRISGKLISACIWSINTILTISWILMISAIFRTSPNSVKVPFPWMEKHLLCSLLCCGSNALLRSLVHWPTAANCFLMSIQPMVNCDSFVATLEKYFVKKNRRQPSGLFCSTLSLVKNHLQLRNLRRMLTSLFLQQGFHFLSVWAEFKNLGIPDGI